ncbi:MAG: outer membrane beta-barrel protein [Vicinamibacterales bacterium]
MSKMVSGVLVVLGAALGGVVPVSAQTGEPPSRVVVAVNYAFQATANDFTDAATIRRNAEDGRDSVVYRVPTGAAFDVAGGVSIWRGLGVGVGVSRFTHATDATASGSIAHPFFFSRPRAITGPVAGLTREELAVHVQARLTLPVGQRLMVVLFAGPSYFQAKQEVVTDLAYTESYPYDTAAFAPPGTRSASQNRIGVNAGGDLGFFFTRQIGVGVTARYAGTTVDLPSIGGGKVSAKVGGVQAGIGLRLRF